MNIGEIAKMAGVSRAAVSRYFNNGYISDEKRAKIKEAVEKTGYVPSMQAQMLRTKKTKMIGVIIPKISSDAIGRLVAGISDVVGQTEYQILLANTDNQTKKELEYLRLLDSKRVDGLIFSGTIFTKEHLKLLKELTVPIVIVSQQLKGYNSVYHDDYQAAREITSLMVEHGQERIGYIGVTVQDEAAGQQRQQGFEDVIRECAIPPEHTAMAQVGFNMEEGYRGAKELLTRMPGLNALVCATDTIAIGAMTYLREQGKRIPEDIQIAGIGDGKMTQVTTPPVTSVHLAYKTSGQEAAKLLLESMEDENMAVKEIKVGCRLIERASTGKGTVPAGSDS